MKKPNLGDKIYVPSSFYLSRGRDDFHGGIATISKIEYNKFLPKNHINYIMVAIKERNNVRYNYRILMKEQEKLKKEHGNQIAKPCPDNRDEFNESNVYKLIKILKQN